MAETVVTTQGTDVIWHDPDRLADLDSRLFDPQWLRESGRLTGSSTGRNTAWFLNHAGRDLVLRHYWRGGMVGRFIKDLFMREAVGNSRAMQEFSLLGWMHQKGLPVPRPVAARYSRTGLWYRADLLMEMIPATRPLADLLVEKRLTEDDWKRIGAVIARMHSLGVQHSDLNCRNILLDTEGQVWLIDFDKCERRLPGKWQKQNLERLERSLNKEKTKEPSLHWTELDWGALLEGYKAGAAHLRISA
jgi:tRNA A-37 threonylcarbamoyl transferase component Bud32